MTSVAHVRRTVYVGDRPCHDTDALVREEPLEIRVNGAPVAVVMRTPGADEALVRGFLLTERIVPSWEAIRSIRPCGNVEDEASEGNVFLATLAPEVSFDLARFRRQMFSSSSCGICGKASVEHAMSTAPPVDDARRASLAVMRSVIPSMRGAQRVFDLTGGLHAAGAFTEAGRLLAVHEDVGRHNAVDKVVGSVAEGPSAERPFGLAVSGRLSFEIVQKALAARIAVLVAVSAPSALAVQLARASNMTLVAFARGDRLVAYADGGHLVSEGSPSPTAQERT